MSSKTPIALAGIRRALVGALEQVDRMGPADADSVMAVSVGRMRIDDMEREAQKIEIDLLRLKEAVPAYWAMAQRGFLPVEP